MFGPYEAALVPQPAPEIAQAVGFISALRAYIVRQGAAPRCSDTVKRGRVTPSVTQFNSLVKQLDPPGNQFKPITEDESEARRRDEADRHKAEGQTRGRSDRGKQALTALRWLNHGNRMRPGGGSVLPWTLEERKSLEWNVRCLEALEVDRWLARDRGSFSGRLSDYGGAHLRRASEPHSARHPSRDYDAPLSRLPGDTLYPRRKAKSVVFATEAAIFPGPLLQRKIAAERAWLLERLQSSNNPIIAAYARIEALLGASS